MAKPKPSEKRIQQVADALTSEHPEHGDLVVVKAAVSRVLHDEALISDGEAVRRTLDLLTVIPQDEGTPEDREAAQVAIDTVKAEDEQPGEIPEENDPEPIQPEPTPAPVEPVRPVAPFVPPSATPQPPGMRLEPVPYDMACSMTLADVIEKGYQGLIVHGDQAFAISTDEKAGRIPAGQALAQAPTGSFAEPKSKWSYRVDDPKRLPEAFKTVAGQPSHKLLEAAMHSESPPMISGVVISQRQ